MRPRRGRRQRPTRAQWARRVRGAFDRTPEATLASRVASTLRRRTRFYRARQMADGRKTSALSATPPGFRAHRRFSRGLVNSTHIRTRPRAAVGSAHAGSSSSPMGTRRHGRRGRRRTVQEKLEPSLNFYVTVMKRSDDTEPVQITLDPVFDVESDGDLENGWSLRRFRVMLIRNLQSARGSTRVVGLPTSKKKERNGPPRTARELHGKYGAASPQCTRRTARTA